MHTYPDYHAPDRRSMSELVLATPFAVLVSVDDTAPIATHVPIVPPPGEPIGDELTGRTLWGHMGRANRHWRRLQRRDEALLVHSTSHAYVSPEHYQTTPAVPTVDYAAVHLTGHVRVRDEPDWALEVVTHTSRYLETGRAAALDRPAWSPDDSIEEFRRILGGVVAFEFVVTGAQAMFKLSQNQPVEVRDRIRAEESAPGCPHVDVAARMALFDHGFEPGEHEPLVERDPER